MSLRLLAVVIVVLAFGCGGGTNATNEPTTAKEKQQREAKADPDARAGAKKWGGWRYKGDRDACFFIVRSKCFKTEKAACRAAKCKRPKTCAAVGAAPAQVSCK